MKKMVLSICVSVSSINMNTMNKENMQGSQEKMCSLAKNRRVPTQQATKKIKQECICCGADDDCLQKF